MSYSDQYVTPNLATHRPARRLKWFGSPLAMIMSLVAAAGLCVAHDLFFRKLNGQHIATALSQTWTSRIATGLAFLIKTLLVLAAGIAYVQRQWLILKKEPVKVDQIDKMTDVLMNLKALASPRLWFKTPVLALAATVSWWAFCFSRAA